MKINTINGATVSNIQNKNDQPINGQRKKSPTGTLEWAKYNVNCISGCSNDCKYCYAKAMAIRFKRKKPDTWKEEVVNKEKVEKKYRKSDGVVMFPSSHDITPNTLDASLVVLKKLLKVKNDVLIVSKPNFQVIKALCRELKEYQEQILIRLTIGSNDNETLKFWEPGASSFEERIDCLKYAFNAGFKTSVSCEPALDLNTADLVSELLPYVTDAVWVGKPNRLKLQLKHNGYNDTETIKKAQELIGGQSEEWIQGLYETFRKNKNVKWKDSIKKVVGIELPQQAGLDI